MKETYKGIYKDSTGTVAIEVINEPNTLTTVIDGVEFSGSELDDLSVEDQSKYTPEQLARFTFLKIPIYQTDRISETLCNCSIEIVVPQVIIDTLNTIEFYADLTFENSLGAPRPDPRRGIEYDNTTLTLTIAGKVYTATGGDFESAADGIRKQFGDRHHFKNCYGCMYGDYSVYGNSTFGSMLCFRNQKEEYSKVTTKQEYMQLGPPDGYVQETYCCEQFEIRNKRVGYR